METWALFEKLLSSGRIRSHRAHPDEIRRLLDLSHRDLRLAAKVMAEDWDWGFSIAYNCVLQAARALMYARGFRPAAPDAHKNTFAFLEVALGEEFDDLVSFFDRMRSKRNQAVYDVAGLITEIEARTLFDEAEQFVDLVESLVR